MKTSKELQRLSDAIGEAERAYHKAIADNLKEGGKEYRVMNLWGDDEDAPNGLNLSIRGDDNDLNDEVIDKVRWNEERGCIEYHSVRFNYRQVDEWANIAYLGEDADYVFQAIDWEEDE